MIIDYDDMLAEGMVKEASDFLHDNANATYAIYLETPSGQVGKFRTTTQDDIRHSIEAINKNASLPKYIKEPAMHFIQKAANDNNIETGWEPVPERNYSRYVEFVPSIDVQPHYVFKLAGQRDVEIYNTDDYRQATDLFKTAGNFYNPKDRIAIAGDLLKTAVMLNASCDPYVSAYAYANYSPRTTELLEQRQILTNNDEAKASYGILKDAYEKLGDTLPPDMFLIALAGIDKQAGVNRDPVKFFQT